ncbi:hypothetical protein HYC85_014737 [Camellia sinensis]|uniref:Uncharacterized protein n=1 Tax=Camellia sinensis TaxID=4442 RepID=A0A7J7H777_CAMSI|nr:hypothetical protein HYC85_014737 [Camellia sinensis]
MVMHKDVMGIVLWAGFDKLECEGGIARQVLLLGYRSGFQVWDVEEANNSPTIGCLYRCPLWSSGYISNSYNGSTSNCHDPLNGGLTPTLISFYSLRSQSYVHELKFKSVVYSLRCSTRVVAVLQAAQCSSTFSRSLSETQK